MVDVACAQYLRPELEAAGLLPKQEEVVVHKPFASGPAPAAATTQTPAATTATTATTTTERGRSSSQGPLPQLGRPGAASNGASKPGPTLGRSAAATTAPVQEAMPEAPPEPEDDPDIAIPRPSLSVEDAKKSVPRGSVLAKAALFSMGKTPAQEAEFQAKENAVQAVGRRPSNAAVPEEQPAKEQPAQQQQQQQKQLDTNKPNGVAQSATTTQQQAPTQTQPASNANQVKELPEEPETPKKISSGQQHPMELH
jgi:hypothetical protein